VEGLISEIADAGSLAFLPDQVHARLEEILPLLLAGVGNPFPGRSLGGETHRVSENPESFS